MSPTMKPKVEGASIGTEQLAAWLTSLGVSFTLEPELGLSRIDQVASRRNQARLEPIDQDVVARYKEALLEGAVFPPVIVWNGGHKTPSDQLVTLSGNHRTHAHQAAGRSTIAAFVVDCTDSVATQIMYEDNARHGLPPSTAERIQQAKHLVATTKGMTVKRAAALVGVGQGSVQVAVQTDGVNARARKLGVNLGAVAPSARFRLAAIKDDRTFVDLAELAAAAKLNKKHLDEIVPKINRLGDPFKQRAYVKEEAKRWSARIEQADAGTVNVGPGRKAQRVRLQDAIGDILDLSPSKVWDDVARENPTYFHERVVKAVRKLITIADYAKANS